MFAEINNSCAELSNFLAGIFLNIKANKSSDRDNNHQNNFLNLKNLRYQADRELK